MRIALLAVLALAVPGSGAAHMHSSESVASRSVEVTRAAGSARVLVSDNEDLYTQKAIVDLHHPDSLGIDDPFIDGGLPDLLDLITRARDVRFVGPAEERGTDVRLYSARLLLDDFLTELPPTLEDSNKEGTFIIQTRDWLTDYFVWAKGGQPLELALDSAGRIRRVDLKLGLGRVTVELYDYGVSQ
jgi:hypothetical protein